MNKVILIGRLCNDVEVRYTQNDNKMVDSFNLAVNRKFAKKEDEKQADFISIVAWGKTAEFCSKYFKKGQQVGIVGRIQTRNYDDKDGKKVYVTEVIAEEVYFADGREEESTTSQTNSQEQSIANQQQITNDDLPF